MDTFMDAFCPTASQVRAPYSQLNNLLYKSYLPLIINSAAEIGLFDVLSAGTSLLEKLAEELNADVHVLDALLDVLEAIGLVAVQDDCYRLTAMSETFLVSSSKVNQLHALRGFSGSRGPFDNLAEALKGDHVRTFNNRIWASEEAALSMEQVSKAGMVQEVVSFVKSIPGFSGARKMCDIAGSVGYYSLAMLRENDGLHAHVYDLPEVCAIARKVKQGDEHFERVTFHDFDVTGSGWVDDGFDLFFSSHFLYEFGAKGTLADFLKKVNASLKPGGYFVSSHISSYIAEENRLTFAMVELMTRAMGYPTHTLPKETLKEALGKAGFGDFTIQEPNEDVAFATMLLSARKLQEIL
ncbi:class I SAM-dependent methyltransferase [Prosthecochloris sp.]|uniref:class I SAM-dependent methyltransferase n=1 Tax=Prosthecochloris sp. TaxID=290513 RepID=UPI00257B7018|nr:class I SAM-dependent methyltransferase [Prosthecochloris sp.]